ncbi:MAG: Uma2 family endonuclease [Desulfomonilaceae bacterium]|nr:Uma2 family endonuclease [Desulfomonilaceae bacterium]
MSLASPQSRCSPEQYLALERQAEYKSEFVNGMIIAMAGASRSHSLIVVNLSREVSRQLLGRPCETYSSDMRVKVSNTGLYTYPDLVAVCGEVRFDDEHADTLLNPTVIVEVLSPSTEAYDRGEKFAHYRRLESLQEYVLVSQDKVRIESYVRQGAQWLLSEVSGLDGTVRLESIGCDLVLRDVYDKVRFGESVEETVPEQRMEPTK